MSIPQVNAVCLVVDRLQAAYLGAYGNAWIATPALDRLAAESFVFDQAYLDAPDLACACRSLWTAGHALSPTSLDNGLTAQQQISGCGVATTLLTDDAQVAAHSLASGFDEVVRLELTASDSQAEEVEQTLLGQFVSEALEWISSPREPFCLWLHIGSLGQAWDAPRPFRERYADDDAIETPRFVAPPSRTLPAGFDPDELLPFRWAYAAQVSVLDLCVGTLLDQLQRSGLAERTLLTLFSTRGYPLGEHGQVGPTRNPLAEPLHEELVHVPLIVRLPAGCGAAARSGALVQPGDLTATLLDWWNLVPETCRFGRSLLPMVRETAPAIRDRLCLGTSAAEHALRTPAWYLRTSSPRTVNSKSQPVVQLYAKPDDRWEVNEVASRCGELAEQLAEIEAATRQAIEMASGESLPPLPEA